MVLELNDIAKTYRAGGERVDVLNGVSLRLTGGKSLALTGESGSGKSTLLHVAAGLLSPDRGQVRLCGEDLGAMGDAARAGMRRRAVGLVFQRFNLIPALDVAANTGFQARLAGRFDPDWARDIQHRLGLEALGHRYPEDLSGGQQQRVAIARALAGRPPLILADEPTGNLDEATGQAVLRLFLDLVAETGAALLLVTHSEQIAAALDGRAHLHNGHLQGDAPDGAGGDDARRGGAGPDGAPVA